VHFPTQRSALLGREHVHWSAHNKTNKTKLTSTKLSEQQNEVVSIKQIIDKMKLKPKTPANSTAVSS